MATPTLETRSRTAVYSPPRPPADRRLTDVRRIDQTYAPPVFASLDAWERRKAELREQILCAAGLWPEPPRPPAPARLGAPVAGDGYTVQTVAIPSSPGFYLTGNLYRPLNATGKRPGLLNPHGHSRHGRLENSENNSTLARCISFARQGYVAFAYDMVGYNDARQIPHHFGDARDWLWGLSALGLQLWNSVRALDFLLGLPDVDVARAGCVGESGGATQTLLLTAIDERVRYVAPVVMVSAHYQGGCVCENAPGLRLGTTNVEIAAMAAPRPMTLVSATGDWTRNTPTVEYPAIRAIYALYGAEDRLSETQIDAPHNFNKASREVVYRFFGHWFVGRPLDQTLAEEPFAPPPESALRVFPDALPPDAMASDAVRRATQRAAASQFAAACPTDRTTLASFRSTFGVAYRQALGITGGRRATADVAERLGAVTLGGHHAVRLLLGGAGERVPALYIDGQAGAVPVVFVHGQGKAAFFREQDGGVAPDTILATTLDAGRPALLVDPFLTGDYQTPFAANGRDLSAPHFLTFNPGDAALRVQDVAAAVAAACRLAGTERADLLGLGDAGLWCILARPLAPGVRRLVASLSGFDLDDDGEYLKRLYVPGLRRCGGLLGALLLAAPEWVAILEAPGAADVSAVAALYKSLGKGSAFSWNDATATDDRVLASLR